MWNRALENWTFGQPLKMPRTLYRRIWFLCETELSQQSRAPCADIIFQTSSAHASLAIFVWNQALAPVSCAFCHLHVPKVLQTFFPDDISLVHTLHTSSITFFRSCELFSNFCHTSSWHYSLVHPVPAVPNASFFDVWCLHEIELSFHGSLVHPCRPDFQRNKARFKTCATVMCTFCRRFLLIEQKRRPYIGDCGSRLQEKTGFHTQESFLAWIHRFSTRYNSHVCSVMMHLTWLMIWLQWWLGWHDDVVHMMMWLPWWWES